MTYTIYQVYFGDGSIVTHRVYENGLDQIIVNNDSDVLSFEGIIEAKAGDSFVTISNNAVTVDHEAYQVFQNKKTLIARAQEALTQSDKTILRCYENAVPVPSEWAIYRANLRIVIRGALSAIPVMPSYPTGT